MSSTSKGQQTAQLLSTVFHAKDLHKRRGRIQVTSFPSVLLPVARRSAVDMSSFKTYTLCKHFYATRFNTVATVEMLRV